MYNLARKLDRTFFSYTFKRTAYVSTQRHMYVPEIQKFDEEIPFIQGIINQANTDLSVTETNTKESFFEYNNWHRSHGGNWNTKYDSSDYINHDNEALLTDILN